MTEESYENPLTEYGCGKLLDGPCYYCYFMEPYTHVTPAYREASYRYHCGDNGGFLRAESPGRLCPDCAVKCGWVW